MTRFQFVADHRHAFEVKRLCEAVGVRRSSFYAWLAAGPARAARAEDDARLAARIRTIHEADNTVGVPRVTPELNEGAAAGERVNLWVPETLHASRGVCVFVQDAPETVPSYDVSWWVGWLRWRGSQRCSLVEEPVRAVGVEVVLEPSPVQ